MDVLFPYDKVREMQNLFLEQVSNAVQDKTNVIAHAPTGLGKTAAALAPALKYAIDNNKCVFFLTSRHTQHLVAIDTLKEVKKKHGSLFKAVDIIGKKWLCLQPGVTQLASREFTEYCRKMREDELCDFYTNLKKGEKLSDKTKRTLTSLNDKIPQVTEEIIDASEIEKVCPYEVSMLLSKDSHVIITDYFYIFNSKIRDSFLKRTGKELEDCIVIVDEAHNLPDRVKDLSTSRITNILLVRAAAEAEKYGQEELIQVMLKIEEIFKKYAEGEDWEKYILKQDFIDKVNLVHDYEDLIETLDELGGKIREENKRSYLAVVGEFLQSWKGNDEGFTRIFSKKKGNKGWVLILSYRCLDPSVVTREVIEQAHSVIFMSGTLTPTTMYKELLGVTDTAEGVFKNPFPQENRLSMIIPKTSTKYSQRNEQQFQNMAEILSKCVNEIPGNSIVFFPSYDLKNKVLEFFNPLCEKTIFDEVQGMSKKEKHDFLQRFKDNHKHGGVMLGVISGNFGEGIDLPGDYLKGVIIVGLPLQRPDLEVKSLIEYYDKKFGKGWDYGYVYPAFNKALQSAGRCIRTETDRGVIIFLDERYTWSNYKKCFPPDWKIETTMFYEKKIRDFFNP